MSFEAIQESIHFLASSQECAGQLGHVASNGIVENQKGLCQQNHFEEEEESRRSFEPWTFGFADDVDAWPGLSHIFYALENYSVFTFHHQS
ncbi:hypothetical protein EVAR_28421_1 [Eumeta japonica]|uniref:Uncharacterized protein n=1 Tax=Eumeta variegata TaxID=151549 RepID=A0A4C1V8T4_EUMVA|nr:hypothetical protein EVAR_28421_1 [Eumeta japonica]